MGAPTPTQATETNPSRNFSSAPPVRSAGATLTTRARWKKTANVRGPQRAGLVRIVLSLPLQLDKATFQISEPWGARARELKVRCRALGHAARVLSQGMSSTRMRLR